MSDLTPDQSSAMDFIGEQANEVTRSGNADVWKANIIANRPYFSQKAPDITGLTVYLVGAGPSLDKNVQELKNVSERGVILCVDAALRFLLRSGVRPEYCFMIDGSEKIAEMIEGCDTRDITLICTPSSSPKVVAAWQGPRFFVTTPTPHDRKFDYTHLTRIVRATKDLKEGDELILDDSYKVEFEGVNLRITTGGNVSTAAHHFCLLALKAQQIVFVGLDLSWTHESHHYAGHEHMANTKDRSWGMNGEFMTHKTPDGEVCTNLSLLAFKRWHEQMALGFPGSCVNATEGGIFGLGQKGQLLDCVEHLTLKEAIAKYTPRFDRHAFLPLSAPAEAQAAAS